MPPRLSGATATARSRVLAGCGVRGGRERDLRSYPDAAASTSCSFVATSVTRLEASELAPSTRTRRRKSTRQNRSARVPAPRFHSFAQQSALLTPLPSSTRERTRRSLCVSCDIDAGSHQRLPKLLVTARSEGRVTISG